MTMHRKISRRLQLKADKDYVILADNMDVLPALPDECVDLVYIDPPFNTGRVQKRVTVRAMRVLENGSGEGAGSEGKKSPAQEIGGAGVEPSLRRGFSGAKYKLETVNEIYYPDCYHDYARFLVPRLREARRLLSKRGSIYVHLDYREVHYIKVELDQVFGREAFLNEIVWAYDYGGRTRRRWPSKHDTILFYAKDPREYYFDLEAAGKIPYMAPSLQAPERAQRGKSPTDVWWHTVVSPTGKEKTGYPNQKPEAILKRIVASSSPPGGRVLDFFAGSGTTGVVARRLGRRFVLVDCEPRAVEITLNRLEKTFGTADEIEVLDFSAKKSMRGAESPF